MTGASRVRRATAGVIVSGLLLGVGGSAMADDPGARKKKIDGQIGTSQEDLEIVSKDLRTALTTLAATNKRVGTARTTLTKAEGELRAANKYNKDIGGKLKVAQANEGKNVKSLSDNTKAQGRTKTLVGGLARRSYMQGGMGRLELTLDVLTSGRSDVTDNLSLADIVLRQQSGVLRNLSGEKSAGKATGNRLTAIRKQVADLKRKAAGGVVRAKKARDSAGRAKTSLDNLQKSQTKAAGDLKRKKDKEIKDLAWLKGESGRLQRVLDARAKARAKSNPKDAPAPTGSDGHFLTGPRPKSQITSAFGYRLHPILGIWLLHAGSDFHFGCGAPVYAAAAGDVIEASTNSIAGNNIVIDHGRVSGTNLATQYEHLSAFVVRGGHVTKGQLIGRVGSTGRSTGCHLHFAVLANGRYVNPAGWIG
ncbi:peptidoglycan DD-metalloendopeptidase family protein [Luteipulveratus mongoliensis]|uniref:M23ase beta-sheet core domain-containing protein n=1 Tax=Luteipulveratus mongoliensis TaxID=571913 RepID=A0A0K1JI63_9MICO|nr:M23 family metallopeptidase [Luteipulveratus mongoliensis]AKU16270.1 hypothetical protein VV02_11015 [Luteipulveratus mongoliensis]